jgi:tetratricopeptide (TPR) repeat protein
MIAASTWAKFGVSKTRAEIMIHYPPAFHTPGRELQIRVSSIAPGARGAMAYRIQQLIEQALTRENFKVNPFARTSLEGSLNEATASVEWQIRSVSFRIHTGEHTEYDKKGKPKQVEDCKQKHVNVTHLVSSGELSLNLTAVDAKTQSILFTQLIQRTYHQESAIAGPKLCGNQAYTLSADQLQDRRAILARLADQTVAATAAVVAGYDEPRSLLLAVDNELKPGNTQALSGNWRGALEVWKEAAITPENPEKEAARQYNLGVAHEALAAAAMRNEDLDEAKAHLDAADDGYKQALTLDRGEKYFHDTLERLQGDWAVWKKQQEQQFLEQSEAANLAPTASAPPVAPITVNVPLEGWPENEKESVHDFRAYVRTRLGAQKAELGEAFEQKLVTSGADYGVPEAIALQVVDSEARRLLLLKQNMQKYGEDFKDVAVDGTVSADEREVLRKRQKTLHLSDAQVSEVESHFAVR